MVLLIYGDGMNSRKFKNKYTFLLINTMTTAVEIVKLTEDGSWVEISTLPDTLKITESEFKKLLDMQPEHYPVLMMFGKK